MDPRPYLLAPNSVYTTASYLLVDPVVAVTGEFIEALGEPEADLPLSVLDGIGSVADVAPHVESKVSSDGTRGRVSGVGST